MILNLRGSRRRRLHDHQRVYASCEGAAAASRRCRSTQVQEVTKFTRLEKVMVSTLASLQLALKGLVVLSSELEAMGNAVYDGKVPIPWSSKGYPSLKPLPLWYADLLRRLDFMQGWIDNGQ